MTDDALTKLSVTHTPHFCNLFTRSQLQLCFAISAVVLVLEVKCNAYVDSITALFFTIMHGVSLVGLGAHLGCR